MNTLKWPIFDISKLLKGKYLFPTVLFALFCISFAFTASDEERQYRGIKYKANRFTGKITKIDYPFFGWVSKSRLEKILETHQAAEEKAKQAIIRTLESTAPDKPEQLSTYKRIWQKIKQEDKNYQRLLALNR